MANKLQRHPANVNILILLYLLTLWVVGSSTFQFRTVAILENGFPGDSARWEIKGDVNNAVITPEKVTITPQNNERTWIGNAYELKYTGDDNSYVSIKADVISKIETDFSSAEPLKGVTPASLLYARFIDKNHVSMPIRALSDLTHANQKKKSANIFSVPTDASYVKVVLLLREFKTKHALVSLEIEQIERTMLYKISLSILTLVPVACFCFALRKLRTRVPIIQISLVLAVALALFVGVLLPGDALKTLKSGFTQLTPLPVNLLAQFSLASNQDIFHFLGFLLLTLAVLFLCRNNKYSTVNGIIRLLFFAIFTEVIQRHSAERTSSMEDIYIDFSGVASGVFIWLCFSRIQDKLEKM